jgi:methyl-accepting chemotaxis protein
MKNRERKRWVEKMSKKTDEKKEMGLRIRFMGFVTFLLLVSVLGTAFLVQRQFTKTIRDTIEEKTTLGLSVLQKTIEERVSLAVEEAEILAALPALQAAVERGHGERILQIASPFVHAKGLDIFTVTDANGVVLARFHEPEKSGDVLAMREDIQPALHGKVVAGVSRGTLVPLGARASVPIRNAAQQIVGVLSAGYSLDKEALVDQAKKALGMEFTVFLGDTRLMTTVMKEGKRVVGTKASPEVVKTVLEEGREYRGETLVAGLPYLTTYAPLLGPDGHPLGMLFAGTPLTILNETIRSGFLWAFGIAGVFLVLGLILTTWGANRVVKPLLRMVHFLERGKEGDLTFDLEDLQIDSSDEIGTMAKALASMVARQKALVIRLKDEANTSADLAESLAALSEETVSCMESARRGVRRVSELSQSNSAAIEETNAGVEEVAASASTAASSAAEGAGTAATTTESCERAVSEVAAVIDKIQNAGTLTENSLQNVNRVAASVSSITQFVATIRRIADQTNLLALNAAIEAARAGEAGRGFAVVAEEVRQLAEESNVAAKQVESLIGSLQNDTTNTLDVTTRVGVVMRETVAAAKIAQKELDSMLEQISRVNDVIQNIAAAAQEQASAAQEMSSGVDQVTRGTLEVVESMVDIGNSADETVKTSRKVAESSQRLAEIAENLRELLNQFQVEERMERRGEQSSRANVNALNLTPAL